MTAWVSVRWQTALILVLFLGSLAVLGYIGFRIDTKYGSTPWGLLGGLLLGLTYGVYRMIREGQRLDR